MKPDELRTERLPAAACRDDGQLRAFVEATISPNAWPIHSRTLRRRIARDGLDLAAARTFTLPLADLVGLMRRIYDRSRRAERMLGIDIAFHDTLHNFEVFLRLLVLEWPEDDPPQEVRRAPERPYRTLQDIEPVIRDLMGRMLELGFPSGRLVRNLLAAIGHDYGHIGGTDRQDVTGALTPLTHEETAERHVGGFGLAAGLPPTLILEALAGIRATTFHIRPDRERIQAANDFERKLMLADVAGCVLPADLWLTHVAMPVLNEKIAVCPPEHRGFVETVEEMLDDEHDFLKFIRAYRLRQVSVGERLWGENIDRKIALIERLLAREELLATLEEQGSELIERLARELANAESLESWLGGEAVDPALRELFGEFLDG